VAPDADLEAPRALTITRQQALPSPGLFEVEHGIFQESSCGTSASAWVDGDAPEQDLRFEIRVVPDTDDAPLMTAWGQDPSLYAGVGACLSNRSRLAHEIGGSWRARAVDQAGNAGPWIDTWDFTLDWPVAPVSDDDTEGEATAGCSGCAAASPAGPFWLLPWFALG
jgi:hypothetical protein